jgi:hypothetical protein
MISVMAYVLLRNIDITEVIINVLKEKNLFDYRKVFNFSDFDNLGMPLLVFNSMMPDFNLAIFKEYPWIKMYSRLEDFFIASLTVFS